MIIFYNDDSLDQLDDNICVYSDDNTADELFPIMRAIRAMKLAEVSTPALDFATVEDETLYEQTGRVRSEFTKIIRMASYEGHVLRPQVLGAYLMRLKNNSSQTFIASLLGVHQGTVSRYVSDARAMVAPFVGSYLTMTRSDIIVNTTSIAKTLCEVSPDGAQPAITIWDGTYLFPQKSSNHAFQRKTYGGQKSRNYQKPMVICTTNGKIVDVPPPLWKATQSDSDILRDIMKSDWFKNTFQAGDVFILDRGFATVKAHLISKGFRVIMPHFLEPGQKHFTAAQANASRICTKMRWIVEARNRSMKRNKFFQGTIANLNTCFMLDDLRFAAACINAFQPLLITNNDDVLVAEKIMSLQAKANCLQALVEAKSLNRKPVDFSPIEQAEPDIPQLDPFHISRLSGSYQLGLVLSYYADHRWHELEVSSIQVAQFSPPAAIAARLKLVDLATHGIVATDPILIRVKLQSRHSSGTEYLTYVLFDGDKEGHHSVIEFYCTCKCGARTTDCCAHSLCLIWYVTHGKYLTSIPTPAAFLEQYFPASVVTTAFAQEDL